MNKETLIAMGQTEEQAKQVMEGLDGSYVPKPRFNEVNTELQTARAMLIEILKNAELADDGTVKLAICEGNIENIRGIDEKR